MRQIQRLTHDVRSWHALLIDWRNLLLLLLAEHVGIVQTELEKTAISSTSNAYGDKYGNDGH